MRTIIFVIIIVVVTKNGGDDNIVPIRMRRIIVVANIITNFQSNSSMSIQTTSRMIIGAVLQCLNDGVTPVMGDILRKYPNLVDFTERVRTTFYPELAEA